MIIRKATYNDTQELMNIWLTVFDDPETFVDWNFKNNYNPENVMLAEMDNKIVSNLHLIPYTINFCGQNLKAVYLSAVATLENYRGKNIASELIQESLSYSEQKGYDVAFLIPAINGFYEKFGFMVLKNQTKQEISQKNINFSNSNISVVTPEAETVRNIYINSNKNKSVYLNRTNENFSLILEDIKNSGGEYAQLNSNDGYILYNNKEDSISLYEICSQNKKAEKQLINFLLSYKKNIYLEQPCVMVKFLNTNKGTASKLKFDNLSLTSDDVYINLVL